MKEANLVERPIDKNTRRKIAIPIKVMKPGKAAKPSENVPR